MSFAILTKHDMTMGPSPRTLEGDFAVELEFSKLNENGDWLFAASFVDPEKLKQWSRKVGDAAVVKTNKELTLEEGWRSMARPKRFERKVRPKPDFEAKRKIRLQAADAKTGQLLSKGFKVAGKLFSASETAQLKWMGMYTGRDLISFPVTVPTLADDGLVSLVEAADVATFYKALVEHVQATLASGVLLKQQIMDAESEDDFPEDNRG